MSIIRQVTTQALKYLDSEQILLFIGPRQAGKTTILHQIEDKLNDDDKIVHFINLEDPDYLRLLNESPKNIFKIFSINLKKKTFLFIDEIQYLDNPSNFLKYLYDEYKGNIKILASGSSAFYIDTKFKDSLAGRKRIFNVMTLSFPEFLLFKGETELYEKELTTLSLQEKEKIAIYYREYIIYGGYPRVVLAPVSEKEEVLRDIAYSYIKKDIFEANIKQEDTFYSLMKIMASQVGQLVNSAEFANTLDVARATIDYYLFIMRKSFHIAMVKPFHKNIRKELTKMPKGYFLDLGLRNFLAADFTPFEQRDDKGALLENAVYRQLIQKYPKDEIRFWRTVAKQEVDFVIKEKEAIEVKVDYKKFKKSKYKAFMSNYDDINFSIASIDVADDAVSGVPVEEVWKI